MGPLAVHSPNDPLSGVDLYRLIRSEERNGEIRIKTRESSTKEFKESFHWRQLGRYARTMAAFANAEGGYIVFGIKDSPRVLVGLDGFAIESFDNLDKAKLTQQLNELFAPEIRWDSSLLSYQSKSLGFFYVYESEDKPVVARKNHDSAGIQESDILYRYIARTERIKFAELKRLMEESRKREQRLLLKQFEELISAGASNTAILDFRTATIIGSSGQKVLIDETLLDKIAFIKEGEFSEVSGRPTLKLLGELQPIKTFTLPTTEKIVKVAISSEDILLDFLAQTQVTNPLEYVKQICIGSTSFLPVHYYRRLAGESVEELIKNVEEISTGSQAKTRLLRRLRSNISLQGVEPGALGEHPSTKRRREFFDALMDGKIQVCKIDDESSARHFFVAIRALPSGVIKGMRDPLLNVFAELYACYYGSSVASADVIRRACCWVDQALYCE